MDRDSIKELIREISGPNTEMIDTDKWVSIPCPLAPFTHEKKRDTHPSAGISVQDGSSIFNCLAGETLVVTRQGEFAIRDLAGLYPELLMPDGSWLHAPVRAYGRQALYRVTLSRNGRTREEYATAGHRWFAQGQGGGRYIETVTSQLRSGTRLQYAEPQTELHALYERAFLHGIIYGDGSESARSKHSRVVLLGDKRELAQRFSNLPDANISHNAARPYLAEHSVVSGPWSGFKSLPETMDVAYLQWFVAGWIATDGCVDERGNVSLSTIHQEAAGWLKSISSRLSLAVSSVTSVERDGYKRGTVWTVRFFDNETLRHLVVRSDQRARLGGRSTGYRRTQWQVVGVQPTDRIEEVFCAEVPTYGAFVLAYGLVTGNCFTCHRKGPVPWLLRTLSRYTGEDYEGMADSIERGEFFGGTIPQWGEEAGEPELVPIDKAESFDLYEEAVGHPYLKKRGISRWATREMELLLDPGDGGEPRILFPVYGLDKKLYGFSGRAIRKSAKLKVKDYFGLPKKRLLLGSHLIRDDDRYVIAVEGLMDYARMRTLGFPGLAFMSSTLTKWQAEILKTIGKPVYFFHDDDEAGRDARDNAKELLWRHVPLMKVRYPKDCTVETEEGDLRPPEDPAELNADQVEQMIADARLL